MEKKQWVQAWFQKVLVERDAQWLAQYAHDPFIFHFAGNQTYSLSHAEYLQSISIWHQRFRQWRFAVKKVLVEDNSVVAVYQSRAIYQGGWMKIPARQQAVAMSGIMVFDWKEGKISECWLEDSTFQLYQQLTAKRH